MGTDSPGVVRASHRPPRVVVSTWTAICDATRSTDAIGYGCRMTDSERTPVRTSTNWPARAPAAIHDASNPSRMWVGRTWRVQRRTADGPNGAPRADRDG